IPRPARTLEPTWTLDPVQDGEREVTLRRVGAEQAVALLYHTPAGPAADSAAFGAVLNALTDTPNGRLHKRLVEAGKARNVFGYGFGLAEPGYLVIGSLLRPTDDLAAARKILLDSVEGLAAEPITAAELKRAQQKAANDFEQTMNDPQNFAIAISESISQGDWRLFFLDRDRTKNLKLDDVNRVAKTWLKPSNRTLGQFVPTEKPDRVPNPQKVDVAATMKDFKGGKAIAAGEAFEATPANIDARTQRFTLPSGLKVALLPKKTRGETVNLQWQAHFGNEANLKGQRLAAQFAANMLMRGTTKHTRAQIADLADAQHATIGVRGNAFAVHADVETRREHLADTLALLAEVLREPAFPAEEFEQLKHQETGKLEADSKEPNAIAGRALTRYLYPRSPDDPRYTATFDEAIAAVGALKLDDVKRFYSEFHGGNNAELAIVGDFDAAAVKAQVTRLFDGWKSKAAYQRVPSPMSEAKATTLTAETPDKANALTQGTLPLPLQDTDADYPALLAAAEVLGQNQFDNRLIARLRIKDGLSYGAGGNLWASQFEPSGGFGFYAIYAPQNRAKVEAGFHEEIQRFARDGINAEELASAKKAYASGVADSWPQGGFEAGMLTDVQQIDRRMDYYTNLHKAVADLTLDQVNAAIRKWIKPENVVWSQAGDFTKTDNKAAVAAPASK
ncbi:insulinase family protein, partial [Rudaea sp.]|uniref:M16 family metallopeptidase n=1 Tax=Rudaea sp. TaxID=2136325 RepID=UPI002ED352A1